MLFQRGLILGLVTRDSKGAFEARAISEGSHSLFFPLFVGSVFETRAISEGSHSLRRNGGPALCV